MSSPKSTLEGGLRPEGSQPVLQTEGEHKAESHTKYNPNGRIPTLVDNETGFTLWESGVIITYLVEKYDTKHTISAASAVENYQQLQWLFFQVSGQGPYFG
ncbi:hypothetical protein DFJ77DRAFT_515578 [Powellomyces hirtus]|nr:hypothetical protein DFJ77DRAFT_515578 [Powellomyces hirtus]